MHNATPASLHVKAYKGDRVRENEREDKSIGLLSFAKPGPSSSPVDEQKRAPDLREARGVFRPAGRRPMPAWLVGMASQVTELVLFLLVVLARLVAAVSTPAALQQHMGSAP